LTLLTAAAASQSDPLLGLSIPILRDPDLGQHDGNVIAKVVEPGFAANLVAELGFESAAGDPCRVVLAWNLEDRSAGLAADEAAAIAGFFRFSKLPGAVHRGVTVAVATEMSQGVQEPNSVSMMAGEAAQS
jgi:hypothetical protein